jgi:dihydropteroate synthase
MLDVGAESTRPGAEPVDPDEEWRRLEPVLGLLRRELPAIPVSVDTRRPRTAARALELGAAVINDVTGFADPEMLALARGHSCGLIGMRSRSIRGDLWMPPYEGPGLADSVPAIAELAAVKRRLLEAGIAPRRILLDPGFGFGTTYAEDLALWEALPTMPQQLRWPVDRFCLGLSRKRFVARHFAGDARLPPTERDAATAAAHRHAAAQGFRVFRTHAVAAC